MEQWVEKLVYLMKMNQQDKDENVKVTVMWTRTTYHNPKQMWVPNHFVPLIKPLTAQTTSNLSGSSTSTQLHVDSFIDFPMEHCHVHVQ
jgi:hypothetical protein